MSSKNIIDLKRAAENQKLLRELEEMLAKAEHAPPEKQKAILALLTESNIVLELLGVCQRYGVDARQYLHPDKLHMNSTT